MYIFSTLKTIQSTKEQEFEQTISQFNSKMETVNTNYKERIEACDMLQAELDKVRAEHETNKLEMEAELAELRDSMTSLRETKEGKEEENRAIQEEIARVRETLVAESEAR